MNSFVHTNQSMPCAFHKFIMTTDWSCVNDGGIIKMLAEQKALHAQEINKAYNRISNEIKNEIQKKSSYPIVVKVLGIGLPGKEAIAKIHKELDGARPWKRFHMVTEDKKGSRGGNCRDGDWDNPDYRTLEITIQDPEEEGDGYL